MSENYIKYWGLERHPFLLAPDSTMMYMAGQYYECLERLKYAVNTNKGGVLIVSEDAGLGKTTTLLRLVDEMKDLYGNAFKYAFVDHPTLTSEQMIAYIAGCFTDSTPYDDSRSRHLTIDHFQSSIQSGSDLIHNHDKLKNLKILKDALIEVKQQGGKSIIIVDEGQMLCGARDILQELRVLINLTYENEYLHTFIFSGQRPLWNEVKSIPEFWQRLPVRYYFVPLKLKETRNLIKYRLTRAGLNDDREIFTSDAIYIIQKYSMGSPRTIIALADLALLIGYTDRSSQIGFKEISKVVNAMSGKGESLPYVRDKRTERDGGHFFAEEDEKEKGPGNDMERGGNKKKDQELVGAGKETPYKGEGEIINEIKAPGKDEGELLPENDQEEIEKEKRHELNINDHESIDRERFERKDRHFESSNIAEVHEGREMLARKLSDLTINIRGDSKEEVKKPPVRPFFIILAFIFSIIAGAAAGYYFAFNGREIRRITPLENKVALKTENKPLQEASTVEAQKPEAMKTEAGAVEDQKPVIPAIESTKTETTGPEMERPETMKPEAEKPEMIKREAAKPVAKKPEDIKSEAAKPEGEAPKKSQHKGKREALITVVGANVRSAPDVNAQRIALIFKGERVNIIDEKTDTEGKVWYKFNLYGSRNGWISEDVVSIKAIR